MVDVGGGLFFVHLAEPLKYGEVEQKIHPLELEIILSAEIGGQLQAGGNPQALIDVA